MDKFKDGYDRDEHECWIAMCGAPHNRAEWMKWKAEYIAAQEGFTANPNLTPADKAAARTARTA